MGTVLFSLLGLKIWENLWMGSCQSKALTRYLWPKKSGFCFSPVFINYKDIDSTLQGFHPEFVRKVYFAKLGHHILWTLTSTDCYPQFLFRNCCSEAQQLYPSEENCSLVGYQQLNVWKCSNYPSLLRFYYRVKILSHYPTCRPLNCSALKKTTNNWYAPVHF